MITYLEGMGPDRSRIHTACESEIITYREEAQFSQGEMDRPSVFASNPSFVCRASLQYSYGNTTIHFSFILSLSYSYCFGMFLSLPHPSRHLESTLGEKMGLHHERSPPSSLHHSDQNGLERSSRSDDLTLVPVLLSVLTCELRCAFSSRSSS